MSKITPAEPGKWYIHTVSAMPPELAPTTIVDVKLRGGAIWRLAAHLVHWHYDSRPHNADVVEWRVIPDDEVPPASRPGESVAPRGAHAHYFKSVAHLDTIDVYRVLALFNVTDPCLQHAIKKLLVAGGRGAGKDIGRDVQEAIDSLVRWQGMRAEDAEVTK